MENETEDDRDYKFAEAFGEDIFGAVPGKLIKRTHKDMPRIPIQGMIVSCVTCACTFINSWYSKTEGNEVFLSWPFLYKQVYHFSSGTRIRDNLNALVNIGQCENNYLPERNFQWMGEWYARRKSDLIPSMYLNASHYKTKGFFKVNQSSSIEMKAALRKAPLLIGVYTSGREWNAKGIIKKTNHSSSYGHVISIYAEHDENTWEIVDWDGEIKLLDKEFPIASCFAILNLPDNYKANMTKIVKTPNGKMYALLPNGSKQYISTPAQLEEWVKQFQVKKIEEVKEEQIARMPDTENGMMFIK